MEETGSTILLKIKAIAITVVVMAVAGGAMYLGDVDYVKAFGPTAGGIITLGVGFFVKEQVPRLIAYLKKQAKTEVTVLTKNGELRP